MSKSDSVQFKYRELVVDPHILSTVFLGKAHYSLADDTLMEELKTLQAELMDRIKDIIANRLTERQREVLTKTYFEQRTQMEVADLLGVCQTTVHKIIHGNIDYSNGGKRYGGAIKKIKRICEEDVEIQEIVSKISDLQSELSDS